MGGSGKAACPPTISDGIIITRRAKGTGRATFLRSDAVRAAG